MTLAIVEYPENPSPTQQERWRYEFESQCGMTCQSDPGESFRSWSKTWHAGQVGILDARVRDQTWASLLQGKCPVSEDCVFVKVIASGSVVISQHGEERTFPVGSVLAVDGGWPFQERFLGSTRLVALRMPKQALKVRGYAYGSRRIIVPEQSSPDVTFLRDLFVCFAGQTELPGPQFRERVGEQTLDMMETLLGDATGSLISGRSDMIILRAKTMIARRLGDSRLNIDQIATELRISANYLAKLFRKEGTTVMRYVLEKRLERAYSLVKQFGQHRMQMQEIAYTCGFESPSHFSRIFKQHFGVSPRDAAGA
ncbi:helix-turn-helix transcriptional regulator [Paraburkholderia solisilvae]|uniref:HTH-type transcriptional activator RhaS n=1 Tax=Paraburkholderia solisilvae TaxID=624376 RepID=A0A6J5DCN0_9BURK|nr:AraC family transcriptional regulator [Paraburkholderia solisilvae]CAB3751693.1 HTH-type transcriptional activator RhaS [Paraburkholderia solisilvae]